MRFFGLQYEWCLNTGDQTQNGNRFNEWIDYYKGGDVIYRDTEQMYSVGNNDLTPVDVYTLGDGEDKSKTNPANVEFFFTFEHPYTGAYFGSGSIRNSALCGMDGRRQPVGCRRGQDDCGMCEILL